MHWNGRGGVRSRSGVGRRRRLTRIVLTSDYTLMTDFRDVPLATFFSCIPTDFWISRQVFKLLGPDPPHSNGVAVYAPYGLRKVEAGARLHYRSSDIVVAHPRHVGKFLDETTEIVGVYAMDPLGLGPVSMTFTDGGKLTPYTKAKFFELIASLQRPGRRYKIVVGGPGVWQFDYRSETQRELGIDHLVHGETDHLIPEIFQSVMEGRAPEVMRFTNRQAPRLDEIPKILGPAMHGMVEVMRGCGRGCAFCEVTLRRPRYMTYDFIQKEIEVNVRAGLTNANLHSDDFFLYDLKDWKTMQPNRDAVTRLFETAMSVPGVKTVNPTHGTVSAAVADPEMIRRLSAIGRAGPRNWIGIQCGLETGSKRLSVDVMPRKALPYEGADWPEVALEGLRVLNEHYWFPAFTLISGLPGELPEDSWDTVSLLDRMEALPNNHFIAAPLSFVPVGVLRGEEFYEAEEHIDEARFNVAYRCWRHTVKEMDSHLWEMLEMALPWRVAIMLTGRLGGRYILGALERYARKRGFAIRAPHGQFSSAPVSLRIRTAT